jgi:hypothetical protein
MTEDGWRIIGYDCDVQQSPDVRLKFGSAEQYPSGKYGHPSVFGFKPVRRPRSDKN